MEIFDNMKKYHKGKSPDGLDKFEVPLSPDADGMVGRECPNEDCQPKYFKISLTIPDEIAVTKGKLSDTGLTCPYCGSVSNMQRCHTKDQIEWIKSMMLRDVAKSIQNLFKDSFRSTPGSTRGMFSIQLSYKPGSLPSVRHYAEEKLKKTVTCDNCHYNYAVYGISFHCPLCGEGNLLQHLDRSAEIIKILLGEHDRIAQERGLEVGRQVIGNALEDVISLFESFLKYIYQYEIRKRYSHEEAEQKISKIRVNFQRLGGAEECFLNDFAFDIFKECSTDNKPFLQEQFLKRHVITHNFGLIDKKYLVQAQSYQKPGAELDIEISDVLRALEIVKRIIESVTNHFIKKKD